MTPDDALTAMGFYNLNPESMKELQSSDAGELLHRDGDNIASVIARLEVEAPEEQVACGTVSQLRSFQVWRRSIV